MSPARDDVTEASQEAHPPHAAASVAGEYQMVEDREVDCFASAGQSPHRATVGPAWPCIPARMIVRQNEPCAAQSCRIDNDVPHRQIDRLRVAIITFDVEAACGRIDMSNPQALSRVVSGVEA
jgi:hypothetical protein